MEILVERCAAIDVGKAEVMVCVRTPGKRAGTRRQQVRRFATMTASLLELRDWLLAERVSLVGMESTGVYWKPVYYLLEDVMQCWLLNPAHVKNVPGRKTDVADAVWLAQLVEHGLVRPSFVAPPPIRALRDLTRYRAALVTERTREVNRLHKLLEDAGIKLSVVASDILGVSGREMLAALIRGDRDPDALAELARARMRTKIPALREALTGRFSDHHARLAQMMLEHIDELDAAIGQLDEQVRAQLEPFRGALRHLDSIPGVGARTAEVIIAETGGDMTRFPSPAQLSSWAGLCPGNNESAGKHHSGRSRPGNVWLAAALGEAAVAASHTKNTYLGARYARLAHRRGRKRATQAVARSILEAAWQVLTRDTGYADLGPDHWLTRTPNKARRAERLLTELRALGYPATLNPAV